MIPKTRKRGEMRWARVGRVSCLITDRHRHVTNFFIWILKLKA